MNCTTARQHWMTFLDNDGSEMHSRLQEHILGCPDCARWFAARCTVEDRINEAISSGEATPQLWERVTARVKATQPKRRGRLVPAMLLSAAAVLIVVGVVFRMREQSDANELAEYAAEWHEQWWNENPRPELESSSDIEVDRYLKARVPFRVHCPPRSDVQFSVQGAGVCLMPDRRQAAYIVGKVGDSHVSILVLDGSKSDGYPRNELLHREAGACRTASAVIKENIVIVTGDSPPEVLDRLLQAYGTYPES